MQMQDEILTRLDAFAAKLGVAADQLWEVMVSRAYLEVLDPIVMVCIICLLLVLRKMIHGALVPVCPTREERKSHYEWSKGECSGTIWAITLVFCSVLCIVTFIETAEAVKAWILPEFWALEHLRELLP